MYRFIVLVMVVAICGCSSGGDDSVLQVAGIYEITSGTQTFITTEDTRQEDDISGYAVNVAQNGNIVSLISCLGELGDDGSVVCDGSEGWSYTFFGAQLEQASGSVCFGEVDGVVVLSTEDLGVNVTLADYGTGGRVEFKFTAKQVY